MLGVGVIGLGVGAHHARAALNHPGVGGVLLRDLDQDRANALAAALKREFPGKEVAVAQTEAGLTDAPGIGAVCVASWDEAHFSQIMAALRAGKHVFAEKPLCQSPGQASAIREALFRGAAPSGGRLRLSANMVLRTCPLFREIRQAWREGALKARPTPSWSAAPRRCSRACATSRMRWKRPRAWCAFTSSARIVMLSIR